jgi:hypothetical protein
VTAFNFGIGTVIGRRTDTAAATTQPSFFGVIQDITIDMDQTLVELYGQLKMPVDIAPSKLKVSGKAKFARLQLNQLNNMILGNTVTSAGGFDMASAEGHNVTVTTFTVTNGSTFVQDLGVFYHSTGKQLAPIGSAPPVGSYIAGAAGTGTYTINSGDESIQLDVYYTYTVTTQQNMVATNNFMGTGPIFELTCVNHYTNNLGVANELGIRLNACRSSKFTFPFSNIQYTIPDFDFQAFADSSGNWGTIVMTE